MLNQLKTIKTNISAGEVMSILAEMAIADFAKREVIINLQAMQNSKKQAFILVYNGSKGDCDAICFSMINNCNAHLDKLFYLEGLRGKQDSVDYRVFNFVDEATGDNVSWVFQAND